MGQRLRGRYETKQQLGAGAFGQTFLAIDHDQPSKPYCVVKQLHPDQAINPKAQELFEKEAQVLERLGSHPQIPRLLAYFIEQQDFYIVQEFIAGHNLDQEIQPGQPCSEAYVVQLLRDVLTVLSFVHQADVIHRDIKPGNLMRRQDGTLFLIDFGAVKQIVTAAPNAQGRPQTATIIGTPGFWPVEQERGHPRQASDVYAVGMTAIYALTGIPPASLRTDPNTLELIWRPQAQVSPALGNLLEQMTRMHFSRRFESATQALYALNQIAPPALAQPSPPISPRPVPLAPPVAVVPTPLPIAPPPSRTMAVQRQPQGNVQSPLSPTRQGRRGVLQWGALAGVGLLTALFWSRGEQSDPVNPDPTPSPEATNPGETNPVENDPSPSPELEPSPEPEPPPLSEIERLAAEVGVSLSPVAFRTVQVNEQGAIVEDRQGEAQHFTEDLGNGVTLAMVAIPGGTFMMGSPETEVGRESDEGPQHEVTVSGFFMGQFAITQAQYQAVMGRNPVTQFDADLFVRPQKPVINVSWHEAMVFCQRLSEQTGRAYTLPSEAQWEYACRAGTTTPFAYGLTITTDFVNFNGNSTYGAAPRGINREQTTEVGSFPANTWGLYDVHGNVWEWCFDHWHENYAGAPTDGLAWTSGGSTDRWIMRGGSWFSESEYCRSANRGWYAPDDNIVNVGFRIVCGSVST